MSNILLKKKNIKYVTFNKSKFLPVILKKKILPFRTFLFFFSLLLFDVSFQLPIFCYKNLNFTPEILFFFPKKIKNLNNKLW